MLRPNGRQLACYASRAPKVRKGTIASHGLGRLEGGGRGSSRNGFFVRHLENRAKYGIQVRGYQLRHCTVALLQQIVAR
ncbi:hypothetical protein BFJ66_g18499 [Fusarium oxysporum f. sp. cepae]|nr:hypothetical protein BFJ66_g18499 [Fusarium oxysporum f. sp. cepae]